METNLQLVLLGSLKIQLYSESLQIFRKVLSLHGEWEIGGVNQGKNASPHPYKKKTFIKA